MMKLYLLLGFFLILNMVSCDSGSKKCDGCITHFEALRKEFADPSKEYRTVPLFVWNTTVTREKIDRTMADLKDKGCGGVFVHPRIGLVTEYLSDEWFDLFRYTVDKGKELDMNTWIYDENTYPSGFAGGHVQAQMPESYNQGKGLKLHKFKQLPDDTSMYFICLKEENGQFIDIQYRLNVEKGKDGNYYLFSKTFEPALSRYGGFPSVNQLHPGVSQKFIDITLDGYKRVIGDEFGKSVPGWFTDEPHFNPPPWSGVNIFWTIDLFDVFQQQWGYDLKTVLPSMFEEVGDWKKVRHNYMQTLLHMFVDRWAKPCHTYCEVNNLIFTGHYWEDTWPDMSHGIDNMAMYAWHQMPAIDMLFNRFDEESPQAQFGNVRCVKELSSVANQMGYRRTMSESYGGGGWEVTFKDFKRLGDWEYALGVNFMNQHISHLSICGSRKNDFPPFFSDHSPWWPYYKPLNMHYAHLSVALSSGEQINDILILEPTSSIWMYYAYGNSNKMFRDIGQSFQTFITTLEKAQVEYDLGSENIIKDHGRIENKKFVVNKRGYSKVVIPPMTENLDMATWKLLKQFIDAGGTVLAFSRPCYLDGKFDPEISTCFEGKTNVKKLPELTLDIINQDFAHPDIAFSNIRGGKLYHHRRIMSDGFILFLVNSSLEETTIGRVSLTGKDVIELNSLTGEWFDYPETAEDNRVGIDFELPPAGSLLLYVFDQKQKGFILPVRKNQYSAVKASAPIVITPDESNRLAIDFCDLHVGGETYRDMHLNDAATKVFRHHGFEGNPWSVLQYKDHTVRRDTFTTGGFKAIYRFTVVDDFDTSHLFAAVECPHLYTISINGTGIVPDEGKWFLDRDIGVLPIHHAVKRGENILTLDLSPMKIHAALEPVFIIGNFSVQPAAKGFTINAPAQSFSTGSWKKQGWPFYNGAVTYSKSFQIGNLSDFYRVKLNNWKGTVAAVVVNGQHAGIIGFEPFMLDVSKWIKQGHNTVEVKIVGSNKNLLGPFHKNPWMGAGSVSPFDFIQVESYPSGIEYRQLDYGLMDDFVLEEGK